ncbi:MAG: SH3 domain-containing protein [Oscillochloris sp.]|nr:SH3 domain-containing protein [Oscillochloris sp.]
MPNLFVTLMRLGVVGLVLVLAGCADLAAALPPRPTPFPTLARLPSVTPVTPSPLPTATLPVPTIPPTPTSVPILGTVTITANVRSGPSTTFDILTIIEGGASVEILGRSGDWYQIRTPDGFSGWLFAQLLDIPTDVASNIPTVVP